MADETMTAIDMIKAIEAEFSGNKTPVTLEQFAHLYGVMAAQQEATIAVFALAMKASPKLIFEEQSVNAKTAIDDVSKAFADALLKLSNFADGVAEIEE